MVLLLRERMCELNFVVLRLVVVSFAVILADFVVVRVIEVVVVVVRVRIVFSFLVLVVLDVESLMKVLDVESLI